MRAFYWRFLRGSNHDAARFSFDTFRLFLHSPNR